MEDAGQEGKVYKETVYRPKDQKERARKRRKVIMIAVAVLILIIIFAIIIGVAVKRTASKNAASAAQVVPSTDDGVIKFKRGDNSSYQGHVDKLNNLLKDYENDQQNSEHFMDCSSGDQPPPNTEAVCTFPLELLGDQCTSQRDFGFPENRPCIAVQLFPPKDWKPEFFTNGTFPDVVPESARSTDSVPVVCQGKTDSDMDNIGNMTYYPPTGISGEYFPYSGQPDYKAPIVMVEFSNLMPGVAVEVDCSALDPAADEASRPLTASFTVVMD